MEATLLNRDEFRKAVFDRDGGKCVNCENIANAAHHIVERRLWTDGGYFVANGASLCEKCHLEAESTKLTCEDIREAAGIETILIPSHLYPDTRYDKWGNPYLPNGLRARGELFFDKSVQKILGNELTAFTKYVKYPRTYHLPWSPTVTKDDRVLKSTRHFEGQQVVVTVKMDGENTTFYNDHMHARSINAAGHPSQSWIRNFHGKVGYNIPENWRICGENLYAKHSIHYHNLTEYFQVFSIWNETNRCLSWNDTLEWANLLDLAMVPVLYDGLWDEDVIRNRYHSMYEGDECEGYVVRLDCSFDYLDFRNSVAKYVREGHVAVHGHWRTARIVVNGKK